MVIRIRCKFKKNGRDNVEIEYYCKVGNMRITKHTGAFGFSPYYLHTCGTICLDSQLFLRSLYLCHMAVIKLNVCYFCLI